jgi:hypothetical protein
MSFQITNEMFNSVTAYITANNAQKLVSLLYNSWFIVSEIIPVFIQAFEVGLEVTSSSKNLLFDAI